MYTNTYTQTHIVKTSAYPSGDMSNVSLSETCWIASLFFHLLDDWLIWFNAFNSKLNDLTWWLKYPQIRTIWWNGYRQVWTISNIVRHIFILNLWDRKFPQTYFISVAMAQEISRTKHWFLTFAVKIFLFGAMRDNGDDAFGEPLSRVDRPVHIPSTATSSVPTTLVTNPISPTIGSSSSTSTPLDLFIVSVQRALDSGLSKETLIANIYLISDERSTSVQPSISDEFFSQ